MGGLMRDRLFFFCLNMSELRQMSLPLFNGCPAENFCDMSDSFVWSLTVVRRPPAFGKFHVGEYCAERGIFRAAGIDAETNFILGVKEMTDAHLMKDIPIFRAFDAEVVFSAAQTVPHGLYGCGNFGGGPVGISSIRDNAAEMLKNLVFILDGSLQPVFAVQVQHDAALIKAMLAPGKISFYHEGKELFFCGHLQDRRIVIAEMIIGPLPQIRMRFRRYFDAILRDLTVPGFSCPFQIIDVKVHVHASKRGKDDFSMLK